MTPSEILDLKLAPNVIEDFANNGASNVTTIRDYLKSLLLTLWDEGESFSGMRPFGNYGWEFDLYTTLIVNGVIGGAVSEYGNIVEIESYDKADKIIFEAIKAL